MSARNKDFTPMEARGTVVYLGRSGGFDVRDCPDPEDLAAFIAESCNAHAIAPPVAAESVDTEEFSALAARYGNSKAGKDYMALVANAAAWGAQQREAGRMEFKSDRKANMELFHEAYDDTTKAWKERAEKAEARAAHLEHYFKHHSVQVPPQYTAWHTMEDSSADKK